MNRLNRLHSSETNTECWDALDSHDIV